MLSEIFNIRPHWFVRVFAKLLIEHQMAWCIKHMKSFDLETFELSKKRNPICIENMIFHQETVCFFLTEIFQWQLQIHQQTDVVTNPNGIMFHLLILPHLKRWRQRPWNFWFFFQILLIGWVLKFGLTSDEIAGVHYWYYIWSLEQSFRKILRIDDRLIESYQGMWPVHRSRADSREYKTPVYELSP